jgi:hypothetical protein
LFDGYSEEQFQQCNRVTDVYFSDEYYPFAPSALPGGDYVEVLPFLRAHGSAQLPSLFPRLVKCFFLSLFTWHFLTLFATL